MILNTFIISNNEFGNFEVVVLLQDPHKYDCIVNAIAHLGKARRLGASQAQYLFLQHFPLYCHLSGVFE